MQREIYEVYAKVVDANGAYNTLSGYPKVYDSRAYGNDPAKALKRAEGGLAEVWGEMCKRDDRQLQIAMLIRASDGKQIEIKTDGTLPDDPGQLIPD